MSVSIRDLRHVQWVTLTVTNMIGNLIGRVGEAALLKMTRVNLDIRIVSGSTVLMSEMCSHYRVPHVRCIVRTRVMCQAGRSRAAGARRDAVAWLCERAPLWVVVHVCALLRDA